MKKLLKQLDHILDKYINNLELYDNEEAAECMEKIASLSSLKFEDDPFNILFHEYSNNGYMVLKTVGREKPYECHGDYIIHPWSDSNGRRNKYFDEDIIKMFEFTDDGEMIPIDPSIKKDDNGKFIDKDGDLIFDEPDPDEYDIVLIVYT